MRRLSVMSRLSIAIGFLLAATIGLFAAAPAMAFSVDKWRQPTAPEPQAQVLSDMNALDSQVLNDFMTNSAAGRYFSNGVWVNPLSGWWWEFDGAGIAAAVLYRQGDAANPALLNAAVDTFNNAIATEQDSDGSFDENAIATEVLLSEFGTTDLELNGYLSPTTQAAWSASFEKAADYLINSGQTTWYANGNIQLRLAQDLWLAWKITGEGRFDTAFENEWAFTLSPPQSRWAGFGLHITQSPTTSNGSDGSGYLAEEGSGAPGFDPEYTMTQLDTADWMWVLSRDPRFLWLTNLLLNQLLPRIDGSFTLDATGGTRKNTVLPFYDVSPDILVADGVRPDLATKSAVQLWRLEVEFTNTDDYNNPNYYEGLGGWVSLPLLDAQWPNGITDAPQATPSTTPTVSVSPSSPTETSLSNPGLSVTVSKVPAGASVNVKVVVPKTKRSSAHIVASAKGKVGKAKRLKLKVRVRGHTKERLREVVVHLTVTLSKASHMSFLRPVSIRGS